VLSNKWIFNRLPMPTGLTLLHQTTGFMFSSILLSLQEKKADKGGGKMERMMAMLPVAAANTLAMYFSNQSMKLASAPFTQTIKSIVPAMTYLIYKFYHKRTYDWQHDAALCLVCGGVFVASSADMDLNYLGLATALLASACTATNSVLSNDRLRSLSPLEAMNVMAPYSIAILAPVWYFTEVEALNKHWDDVFQPQTMLLLLAHGIWVFMLNFVSQFKNACVSPVLGTCSGNMKVVFIYIFSWLLLGTELNIYIWIGSSMTIAGGVCFGMLKEGFDIYGMITGRPTAEITIEEKKGK